MKPVVTLNLAKTELAQLINAGLQGREIDFILREFPDGETYFRLQEEVIGKTIIVIADLSHPNNKIIPLLFIAETLRELGASSIGLVAPYLPYMRQDKRFNSGEALTANYFAKLLSNYFSWLVTVDPHLHRHLRLDEIYSIQSTVVHAAGAIAHWIKKQVTNPLLIGPDNESEQWVVDIASRENIPYLILNKVRYGDTVVEISKPDIQAYLTHTPILIDDIISTGKTMIKTVEQLKQMNRKAPLCIGVHGLFVNNAYRELMELGVKKIVTCNTITHATNEINLADELINGIKGYVA